VSHNRGTRKLPTRTLEQAGYIITLQYYLALTPYSRFTTILRTLNLVEPFPSARESIITLFGPLLRRKVPTNKTLTLDANFLT
jgi:hypothetical protein